MERLYKSADFFKQSLIALLLGVFLVGCGATLPAKQEIETGRHIEPSKPTAPEQIPEIVEQVPVDQSTPQSTPDLYSVVAQDLPVRELLFTIARDAAINIDVHPDVSGRVSLNAIDQTLPQILNRITRQTQVRWSYDYNGNLLIEQDSPYWNTYRVDYVNVSRSSSTAAEISTSIVSVGGGAGAEGNNSSVTITQNSVNNFWEVLVENLEDMVADGLTSEQANNTAQTTNDDSSGEAAAQEEAKLVIANAQSGVIAIKATDAKHKEVNAFLNFVKSRSLRQVLIEATVVEVALNDRYQAGVDWSGIDGNDSFVQNLTGGNLTDAPVSLLTINGSDVSATVKMLSQFGNSKILSSPKIMALNNQPAMLRVVDNKVYFTIEVEPTTISDGVVIPATYSSTINTVPVGFSMTVTPQVGDNDQVTLNVRPTISRIVQFVNDPNPVLAQEGVVNAIPEIQIREMESVLKVYSGQTAVLGGLMQDSLDTNTDGIPAMSRIPILGNLFSYRDDTASKTELIIFIRPVVIHQPSVNADLQQYKQFLPVGGASNLKSSSAFNSDFWGQ